MKGMTFSSINSLKSDRKEERIPATVSADALIPYSLDNLSLISWKVMPGSDKIIRLMTAFKSEE
jgi:hypothetical protein